MKCIDCGKIIYRYAKRCKPCDYKVRGDRQRGENNPIWKGGKRKCKDCGKEIEYESLRCHSCAGFIRRGQNKFTKICKHCGKEYRTYNEKSYLCSKVCQYQHKVKENACNWQGGLTLEEYPKEFSDALKEQIRFRDKYKCQECGCPQIENGALLPVHHIDYDKNNSNHNNLISLCFGCHGRTNTNRSAWELHFKEKIHDYSHN